MQQIYEKARKRQSRVNDDDDVVAALSPGGCLMSVLTIVEC